MSSVDAPSPPQPPVDVDSRGFWEATARHELAICRCQECRKWLHPPLERCRWCRGATAFEQVSGRATLHSFIVIRRAAVSGYQDVPYVVGLVELDEQPRLRISGRLVGVDPGGADVRIGERMVVDFEKLAGGPYTVHVFRPDPGDGAPPETDGTATAAPMPPGVADDAGASVQGQGRRGA